MLYLHGFGSSQSGDKADLFRSRCLERGSVTFCSFDFQGHGDSDGDDARLSPCRATSPTSKLVHTFLEHRGHSHESCCSALRWAASPPCGTPHRHPDRVVASILLAPALGLEENFTERLGRESVEKWEREGKLAISHDLGTWDVGWGFVEDLRRHDEETLWAAYRTPTLIFQGKHDDSVPWRRVVDFTTHAAGEEIELHLFADGDHRLIDRLPRLWTLTEEFLAGRGLLTDRNSAARPA